MKTMKRWEMLRTGRDALELNTVLVPQPASDEVLVKVLAVSLNHRDKMVIEHGRGLPLRFPFTPGSDLSGCVVATGSDVTRFVPGDEVISVFTPDWQDGLRPGNARELSYRTLGGFYPGVLAEYVAMKQHWLVRKPVALNHVEASTLPCAALTAWFALVERGNIQSGETVLIQGTGGVALSALQIVKMKGAQALLVTRTSKVGQIATLGVRDIIDRDHEDVVERVLALTQDRGVDHVLEIVGGDNLGKAAAMAAIGGKIYLIGALKGFDVSSPLEPLLFKDLHIYGIGTGHRRALTELCAAIDQQGFAPVIDKVYALEALPAALEHLDRGPVGKLVISLEKEFIQ
ncbi:NAD(P)-dependent alcohol dehydrogenase [Kosakonia sp. H02]|nr:NAD(P)-dependent alcohol dehydrogenase [Kosakonia sp. H02]